MARKKKIEWTDVRIQQVAGKSLVDRRTIRRWLAGEAVRTSSVARIQQAVKELGL